MIDNDKEYILCAAIRRIKPKDCTPYYEVANDIANIEIGYRHSDILQRFNNSENKEDLEVSIKPSDQGFFTSKGRFVDRIDGMEIAWLAGQVSDYVAHKDINKEPKINFVSSEDPEPNYREKRKNSIYNILMSENLY